MNCAPVGATPPYWEETTMQPVKFESCNSNDGESHPNMKDEPNSLYRFCEGNLNFATVACSEDDSEYGHFHKKNKVSRQDPMSHRIIEKRRRDRMNNCLADLSRLIPADYLKKGRGRIEKTEIIEMAIKHMKYLQQNHQNQSINSQHYRLGFQECLSETMRFLVEVEGFFAREALCVKLISHLQAHCEAVLSSDRLHLPTTQPPTVPAPIPLAPPQLRTSPVPTLPEDPNASHLRDMLTKQNLEDSPTSTKLEYTPNVNEQIMYEYQRAAQHQETRKDVEPNPENNNGLYKFKNNIMQRISQESVSSSLFSHNINKLYKRRKMEMHESTQCASSTTENYCYSENSPGSQTSPSSSDIYTRVSSESDPHRVSSPTGSSVSDNKTHQSPKRYFAKTSRSEIIKPTYRYSPPRVDNKSVVNVVKEKPNFSVPIFVLHAKGSFYIPLTIDYNTLAPYLANYNILEVVPTIHSMVLHPVTINVNFQPSISAGAPVVAKQKYKTEQNGWH